MRMCPRSARQGHPYDSVGPPNHEVALSVIKGSCNSVLLRMAARSTSAGSHLSHQQILSLSMTHDCFVGQFTRSTVSNPDPFLGYSLYLCEATLRFSAPFASDSNFFGYRAANKAALPDTDTEEIRTGPSKPEGNNTDSVVYG